MSDIPAGDGKIAHLFYSVFTRTAVHGNNLKKQKSSLIGDVKILQKEGYGASVSSKWTEENRKKSPTLKLEMDLIVFLTVWARR